MKSMDNQFHSNHLHSLICTWAHAAAHCLFELEGDCDCKMSNCCFFIQVTYFQREIGTMNCNRQGCLVESNFISLRCFLHCFAFNSTYTPFVYYSPNKICMHGPLPTSQGGITGGCIENNIMHSQQTICNKSNVLAQFTKLHSQNKFMRCVLFF